MQIWEPIKGLSVQLTVVTDWSRGLSFVLILGKCILLDEHSEKTWGKKRYCKITIRNGVSCEYFFVLTRVPILGIVST